MYYYGWFLAEKSIGETMVNTAFQHAFAGMSVLLKDFIFAWLG